MINLKMNNNCGLQRVIIVLNEENGTYDLKAQAPYDKSVHYKTVLFNIKDIETAQKVKEAYIQGLYDGEKYKEIEIKNKQGETTYE